MFTCDFPPDRITTVASADLQLFNDVGLDGQVNEEAEEVMLDGPMVERGEMLDVASEWGRKRFQRDTYRAFQSVVPNACKSRG